MQFRVLPVAFFPQFTFCFVPGEFLIKYMGLSKSTSSIISCENGTWSYKAETVWYWLNCRLFSVWCMCAYIYLFFFLRWMSKLWNAVIVPKVEEAILFLATVKRSSILGHVAPINTPSQGQQAVVRAALSILLNKAILHGCHLPKNGKCCFLNKSVAFFS